MAAIHPPMSIGNIQEQGGGSSVAQVTDNQNEAVGVVFTQPIDDTITHLCFVNHSKTLTPVDDTYTVSLQSVTDGLPAGILGGGSPASATFPNATYPVAGFGSGTEHWIALANSIALQAGTDYAISVQKTGADDTTNYLTLRIGFGGGATRGKPYYVTCNSAGTWTKNTTPNAPFTFGMKSASRYYLEPGSTYAGSTSIGNTAEAGFTFTIPAAFGANTMGLREVEFIVGSTVPAAAGTFTVTLYSGPLVASPTILQQALSVDSDAVRSAASTRIKVVFPEDALTALDSDTVYGIGISHSAAASLSLQSHTITAGDEAAYNWGGFMTMTRTLTDYPPSANDTNAFTASTTAMTLATLGFADITVPAGGGGVVNPINGLIVAR